MRQVEKVRDNSRSPVSRGLRVLGTFDLRVSEFPVEFPFLRASSLVFVLKSIVFVFNLCL